MQLQIFDNFGFKIRVGFINDEPYFVAMDIAKILEYTDTQAMTRRLDDDEVSTYTDKLSGQVRHITIINESGLYNAILGSKKPQAKQFKKWVTSEVLPIIRKQGSYLSPQVESTLIEELKEANLSKDSLKSQNESLKDELLQVQRELLSFYKQNPKTKVRVHSKEVIAKIQELAKSGLGVAEIAKSLNVSKSSVEKYRRRLCN